jgi:hypothetical protein
MTHAGPADPRSEKAPATPKKGHDPARKVGGLRCVHTVLTCAALVAHFLIPIAIHLRARELCRNLFVNASGMLLWCVATEAWLLSSQLVD